MEESSCHPALLLEDVLEFMFKIMPFEELKECRRVCRKWEEVSKPLLKKQGQLRLSGSFSRNLALGEFLGQGPHFFIPSKLEIQIDLGSEMTEEMHDWKIENPSGDNGIRDNNEGYKEQLQEGLEDICGILGQHSLEELQMSFLGYSFPADRVLRMLGLLSASLKSVWIRGFLRIPSTCEQILISCSLLTKLTIGAKLEWFHNRIFSVCPNLTEINCLNCFPLTALEKAAGGLKKISGLMCSTQVDLGILGRKSGHLEEFSLVVNKDFGAILAVLEFVQSKRESLKVLELNFQKLPTTLRLGRGFNQLTKLHLEAGFWNPDEGKQFALDICFSRDTPQLKYLKLNVFGDEQNWKDLLSYRSNITKWDSVDPLRSLTHLDLSVGPGYGRGCANYLRQLFPSLTSFQFQGASEDFLRGVWQMKNLVEIHMFLYIEDVGTALFGTPLQDQEGEEEESILNLTKLRSLCCLNLRGNWQKNGGKIPEETIRNGFGKMRRLAVLKLPHFYMAPEGREFLRAALPYLKELKLKDDQ